MQLSLRRGERIFLNGAVVRVDRRVTIELMNDVTFLLESHVMQPEDSRTPLRQLYFTIQMMLLEPTRAHEIRDEVRAALAALERMGVAPPMDLAEVGAMLRADRLVGAMKRLRRIILAQECTPDRRDPAWERKSA